MTCFQNIRSLADLKRQYRTLALANHPDRGGSTEAMQKINAEFEKLFKIWEHDTSASSTATGYENDYRGTTAREYTGRVYNEYRWTGSRYKGQHPDEIVGFIRKWLKETYSGYKFSVRRENYHCIDIDLMAADFEAFMPHAKNKACAQVNQYHLDKEHDLTHRALEVLGNVIAYANSYNFDDSDIMTDYFHVNFYLQVGIGNCRKPYKVELPRSRRMKGDASKQFRHPEGAAHKAIRQALAGARFGEWESRKFGRIIALGNDYIWREGEKTFSPLDYSSAKTAQKRIDRLRAAGIVAHLTGRNGGVIEFGSYTPETEAALERERNEYIEAHRLWKSKQAA